MRSRKAATSELGSDWCRSRCQPATAQSSAAYQSAAIAICALYSFRRPWVVLVKLGPKQWDRYGLKSWIEAAKKRLHHNVLAIALANKLARVAWAVLHNGRAFECVRTNETGAQPA